MSTRSRIGILNKNGTVESVYCHQDGYPEYTGYFLQNFYTSEKLVRNLINQGDISNIASCYNWHQEKQVDENNREILSLKTYQQRGDTLTKELHKDIFSFVFFDSCDEFKYLYYPTCEWVAYKTSDLHNLNCTSDLFVDIPTTSRFFDFDNQVINKRDFLLQEVLTK